MNFNPWVVRRWVDWMLKRRIWKVFKCGSCWFEPRWNKMHEVSILIGRFRRCFVFPRNDFCRSFKWKRTWCFETCRWVWAWGMLSKLIEGRFIDFFMRTQWVRSTRCMLTFLKVVKVEFLFEGNTVRRCVEDRLHGKFWRRRWVRKCFDGYQWGFGS